MSAPVRSAATRVAAALLLPAALVLAGCASGFSGGTVRSPGVPGVPGVDRSPRPDSTSTAPMVRVINDRDTPMDVHLDGNGQTKFLGTVAAFDTLEANVPEIMLGTSREVRLRATPLGGGTPAYSGRVYLRPGDVLQWTITPQ